MIVLCGVETSHDLEPCLKAQGHEGEHVFWFQTKPNARTRQRNGVYLVSGSTFRVLAHASWHGAAKAIEVAALLELMDALAAKRERSHRGEELEGTERRSPAADPPEAGPPAGAAEAPPGTGAG